MEKLLIIQPTAEAKERLWQDGDTMYYKKDELVDTVITDINGIAISKDLIIGKKQHKER